MVIAVVPWAAAWLITLAEWAMFSGGVSSVQQVTNALFAPSNLGIPVLLYAAYFGINQFLRKSLTLTSQHQHWTAGRWYAIAALAVVTVLALPWGGIDSVAYQEFWAIFSGYAVLVFLAGARTWRRNEAPYPRQNTLQDAPE